MHFEILCAYERTQIDDDRRGSDGARAVFIVCIEWYVRMYVCVLIAHVPYLRVR
uniref:Uncharacterized protein n=1 Tax=Ascaris lumbricoides TaxID=6252 RepID=A0A0M3IH59_ASCLU